MSDLRQGCVVSLHSSLILCLLYGVLFATVSYNHQGQDQLKSWKPYTHNQHVKDAIGLFLFDYGPPGTISAVKLTTLFEDWSTKLSLFPCGNAKRGLRVVGRSAL
ncbi:hypothetical protein DPV78_012603 [Talaromyces pinophilus]|nr:hypothetical protein DPV78_012603 [Talaromyces pinophilus]